MPTLAHKQRMLAHQQAQVTAADVALVAELVAALKAPESFLAQLDEDDDLFAMRHRGLARYDPRGNREGGCLMRGGPYQSDEARDAGFESFVEREKKLDASRHAFNDERSLSAQLAERGFTHEADRFTAMDGRRTIRNATGEVVGRFTCFEATMALYFASDLL